MTTFDADAESAADASPVDMSCLACNLEIPQGAAFCAHCGAHQGTASDDARIVDLFRLAVALIAAAAGVPLISFAGSIWGTVALRDRFTDFVFPWEQYLLAVLLSIGATAAISVWAMATAVLFGDERFAEAWIAATVGALLLVGAVVATVSLHV